MLSDGERDFKKRKPDIAFLWSFLISGGGQFYNGQEGKGLLMIAMSTAGLAGYLEGSKIIDVRSRYPVQKNPIRATGGVLLLLGTELWSMIDAPLVARKLNKKNGVTFNIEPSIKRHPNLLTSKNELSFDPKLTISF